MADRYVIFGATYDGDGTLSTEASGSTVTITIATPGVVTWTAHGMAANDVVYLETTGALPTGLNGTTKYYVRNPGTNTFELSLTSGGASIATSGTQSGTHYCSTPGAWRATNSTGATLTSVVGTINHGSLAAGDVVYVRSKTGNGANANISFTLGASISLGSASATAGSPITWILDNGTVWASQDGTLTFTSSSTSFAYTLRNYNKFVSKTRHNWILENTATVPVATLIVLGCSETYGVKISQPNRSSSVAAGGMTYDGGYHQDMRLTLRNLYTGAVALMLPVMPPSVSADSVFDNLEVDLSVASSGGAALFGGAGYFCRQVLRGGRMFGTGATTGASLFKPATVIGNSHQLEAYGFQVPKAVALTSARAYPGGKVRVLGADNGLGCEIWDGWGNADCRNYTANYPYLNATQADSAASPVTWRIVPAYATPWVPAEVTVAKLYTSAAATKTVTLELLVSDNWTAGVINRNSVWMTVSYIDDASGEAKTQTTKLDVSGTALDTSTQSWSATTWGVINFAKRYLSLTTTYSIKQNTMVTVTLYISVSSVTTTYDQLMMDPDPQLS